MSETVHAGKIRLMRHSNEYWRVTFDLPPLNIFGPAHIPQLEEVVSLLETDGLVKLMVFDGAVEGFFIAHYDFLAKLEDSAKYPLGSTGLQPLPDMFARLSRAAVVSISLIRGRATGVGSELALARTSGSFAMGSRGRSGSWRRTHGAIAAFDRAGTSSGSSVGCRGHRR